MRFAIALGLAGLSAVALPALAQSRSLSNRGSGALQTPKTFGVPLYQVNLKQSSRTLTLMFLGRNTALPLTLEGRITGNPSASDLPVEITGGLSDPATRGTGRVVLSGTGVASVDLEGTGKQGPFRLQFRGDGDAAWTGGGTGARPINESAIGSGTYEWSGRRYNLSGMRIRLFEDGRAELSFSGDRSVGGRGTWGRGVGGRADIALTEWNGQRTSGNAAVTFRGNVIERIEVSVALQNARVEFLPGRSDGGGDWGDGNTGVQPINMSTTGSGTYELLGRRYRLDEMRIRLRDDGRAELRFDGDRDVDSEGTWRRGSDGRAEIDVTEWNGRRTSGTAVVTYRGREIERVGVTIPQQNARVEFYPTGSDAGDNWEGDNNAARPINTSFIGTGTFRERGRTYQLDEVSVRLRDNGEAELRFTGERQTSGRGRWTPNGNYAHAQHSGVGWPQREGQRERRVRPRSAAAGDRDVAGRPGDHV